MAADFLNAMLAASKQTAVVSTGVASFIGLNNIDSPAVEIMKAVQNSTPGCVREGSPFVHNGAWETTEIHISCLIDENFPKRLVQIRFDAAPWLTPARGACETICAELHGSVYYVHRWRLLGGADLKWVRKFG